LHAIKAGAEDVLEKSIRDRNLLEHIKIAVAEQDANASG
jgi:FixJ family two-component response regulator